MHVQGEEVFYGILNLGLVKGQVWRQLGQQQRLRSLSTRSACMRQLRWWMVGSWVEPRLPIPIFLNSLHGESAAIFHGDLGRAFAATEGIFSFNASHGAHAAIFHGDLGRASAATEG